MYFTFSPTNFTENKQEIVYRIETDYPPTSHQDIYD